MLTERRNQYQIAAVNAKHSGNNQQALKYLRIKKVKNRCIKVVVLLVWKSKECVTFGGLQLQYMIVTEEINTTFWSIVAAR